MHPRDRILVSRLLFVLVLLMSNGIIPGERSERAWASTNPDGFTLTRNSAELWSGGTGENADGVILQQAGASFGGPDSVNPWGFLFFPGFFDPLRPPPENTATPVPTGTPSPSMTPTTTRTRTPTATRTHTPSRRSR